MAYKRLIIEITTKDDEKRYFIKFGKNYRLSSAWNFTAGRVFTVLDKGNNLSTDYGYNLDIDYAMTILEQKGYKPVLKEIILKDL